LWAKTQGEAALFALSLDFHEAGSGAGRNLPREGFAVRQLFCHGSSVMATKQVQFDSVSRQSVEANQLRQYTAKSKLGALSLAARLGGLPTMEESSMRKLTSIELRTVSGGAVAVEPPGKGRIHLVTLPEQAHFDTAPPLMLRKRPADPAGPVAATPA